MNTKKMIIETIELPDNANEDFIHRTEEREDEICCVCGFSEYPECKSFCHNFNKNGR